MNVSGGKRFAYLYRTYRESLAKHSLKMLTLWWDHVWGDRNDLGVMVCEECESEY